MSLEHFISCTVALSLLISNLFWTHLSFMHSLSTLVNPSSDADPLIFIKPWHSFSPAAVPTFMFFKIFGLNTREPLIGLIWIPNFPRKSGSDHSLTFISRRLDSHQSTRFHLHPSPIAAPISLTFLTSLTFF